MAWKKFIEIIMFNGKYGHKAIVLEAEISSSILTDVLS